MWSQISISSRISDISISRCEVVVSFVVVVVVSVVNFCKSLGVMWVPARYVAWVRCGRVNIFVMAIFRACLFRSSSVAVAVVFISGGSWSLWIGSLSEIGGPVAAVHMSVKKFDSVVVISSSGSAETSPFKGGVLLDVVISPFILSLFAEIAILVSESNVCCTRL